MNSDNYRDQLSVVQLQVTAAELVTMKSILDSIIEKYVPWHLTQPGN